MEFKNLTPEQQEKARTCQTPEELVALAKAEGSSGAARAGMVWRRC